MKRIKTLELLIACSTIASTVSAAGKFEIERTSLRMQDQETQPRRDLTQTERDEARRVSQEVFSITSKLPQDRFPSARRTSSDSASSGSVTPISSPAPDEGIFVENSRFSEPLPAGEGAVIKAESTRNEVKNNDSTPMPIDEQVAHEMKWYTNLVMTAELFGNLSPLQREKLLNDIADTTPDEAGMKHLEQTIEKAKKLELQNKYAANKN